MPLPATLREVPLELRVRAGSPPRCSPRPPATAALLVVGHRGRGMVGRAVLGSTALRVLSLASCPVLVDRPREAAADGPVVVGIDRSAGSAAALRYALRDATRRGVGLVAVTGTAPPPVMVGFRPMGAATLSEVRHALQPRVEQFVGEVVERGRGPTGRATPSRRWTSSSGGRIRRRLWWTSPSSAGRRSWWSGAPATARSPGGCWGPSPTGPCCAPPARWSSSRGSPRTGTDPDEVASRSTTDPGVLVSPPRSARDREAAAVSGAGRRHVRRASRDAAPRRAGDGRRRPGAGGARASPPPRAPG